MEYQGGNISTPWHPVPTSYVGNAEVNYFYNGSRKASLATGSILADGNNGQLYWKAEIYDANSGTPSLITGADGDILDFTTSSNAFFRIGSSTPNKYVTINISAFNAFVNNGSISTAFGNVYLIKLTLRDCDPNQTGIVTTESATSYLSTYVTFS